MISMVRINIWGTSEEQLDYNVEPIDANLCEIHSELASNTPDLGFDDQGAKAALWFREICHKVVPPYWPILNLSADQAAEERKPDT